MIRISKKLQALADEQELVEKYRLLVEGEIMNTGEKRMVLHHMARGRLGKAVRWEGQDMEAFYSPGKAPGLRICEKGTGRQYP
jgi:glucose-6-phosphate isomerase (EC 5.3.1.9)